jgi:cathepsin A (carboxypeptidase C)
MKLLASAVLLGAASASVPQQQVLGNPFKGQNPLKDAAKPVSDAWSKSLNHLAESMRDMTSEAKAVWDEVSTLFPEAMERASFFSTPKPHSRKPDHTWDYVVKGADIQSVWIENSNGEKEREIDGKLDAYNLRAKKVDPSKLGVDTVKQYSGYLDDEENDKHLFYCKYRRNSDRFNCSYYARVL